MAGEAPEYIAWLHGRSCLLANHGGCSRAIHAHHPRREGGTGLKGPDWAAIPLCSNHHNHDLHGGARRINGHPAYFRDMTKEERMAWEDEQGERMRAIYLQQQRDDAAPVPF